MGDVSRDRSIDTDRGQTVLDFAVGSGVFLVAVAATLAFVPAMFDPFVSSGGEQLVTADRAAAQLVGGMLAASPGDPAVLDTLCTIAFFQSSSTVAGESTGTAECGFDPTADVDALLGTNTDNVEVVVHGMAGSVGSPADVTYAGTSYQLRRSTGGTNRDVTVAKRIVLIDGSQYKLVVRVW